MKLRAFTAAITFLLASCAFEPRLADFKSDGCTLFPDRSPDGADVWCECCVEHDLAYWKGGTDEERLAADRALERCIARRTGSAELAELVFNGVRAGGLPQFPTWYRWGYGWNYLRPAAALDEEERAMVARRLRKYRREGSPSPCDH